MVYFRERTDSFSEVAPKVVWQLLLCLKEKAWQLYNDYIFLSIFGNFLMSIDDDVQ